MVVGEKVYSRNEKTGETGYKNVEQIFIVETHTIHFIEINGVVLKTTTYHPFYVEGQGWVSALNLKEGYYLASPDGVLCITKVGKERYQEPVAMYNFHVEDWVSYVVSQLNLYVHNGRCPKGNGKVPANKTTLWGQEKTVTEKGLQNVKDHLSGDFSSEFNDAMINRLEDAYKSGNKIRGADLDFYAHELYESTLMKKGMDYNSAHDAAKSFYNAKEFNFYHPDVIKQFPTEFNSSWFDFWGLERN